MRRCTLIRYSEFCHNYFKQYNSSIVLNDKNEIAISKYVERILFKNSHELELDTKINKRPFIAIQGDNNIFNSMRLKYERFLTNSTEKYQDCIKMLTNYDEMIKKAQSEQEYLKWQLYRKNQNFN